MAHSWFKFNSVSEGEMTGSCSSGEKKKATTSGAANVTKVETDKQSGLKRTVNVEGVYFVDATKEGNVSRFINVSDRVCVSL